MAPTTREIAAFATGLAVLTIPAPSAAAEPVRKPPIDVVVDPPGGQVPSAKKAPRVKAPAPAPVPVPKVAPRPAPPAAPPAVVPPVPARPAAGVAPSARAAASTEETTPAPKAALETEQIEALRERIEALRTELRPLLDQDTSGADKGRVPAWLSTLERLALAVERLERDAAAKRAARTEQASRAPAPPAVEPEPLGLTAEVHWATAFAFRGANVYRESSQADMHALFNPSVTWAPPNVGLAVAYSGYYQATGSNRAALVDSGVGHEQDIMVSYSKSLGKTTGSVAFTYSTYPFATAEEAGARWPSYAELAVGASRAGPVDLGVQLLYYHGLQSALESSRYAYVHPTASKTFSLAKDATLSVTAGAGYKDYSGRGARENRWDAHLDWKLTFPPGGGGYVAPALHWAWTDLESKNAGEEMFVWSGIASGIAL